MVSTSRGAFSGTSGPALDGDLQRASELSNPATRQKLYDQIDAYIDKEAYAVPIYQRVLGLPSPQKMSKVTIQSVTRPSIRRMSG
jgi:ABC-type transport system substrate-binding protein